MICLSEIVKLLPVRFPSLRQHLAVVNKLLLLLVSVSDLCFDLVYKNNSDCLIYPLVTLHG